MSAERAESILSDGNRRLEGPFSRPTPRAIKIVDQPARSRIGRLVDLTNTLLQEIEILARDQASIGDEVRLQNQLQSEGIDLFQELKRFEIQLIKLALDRTHGHQARAARLLKINPTTLNSKIKLYSIEY
jgi:DNA-binding NtrC family response regulator